LVVDITYSNDNGWLRGQFIRDVDVHVDLRRVPTEVGDLLQLRTQAQGRERYKREDVGQQHIGGGVVSSVQKN
jgi:hypothetical protein